VRRRRPVALVLAVVLDWVIGEPPVRCHPVAWLGRAFAWAERRAPGRTVADGAAAVAVVLAGAGLVAAALGRLARRVGAAGVVLEALLLKPAFAWRGLAEATAGVEAALRAGDLVTARHRAGWDLVSRPTVDLTAEEVASAAIESAAENLVDSIAAPLFAYAAVGLPGAWVYRAINTADAMWGYRTMRYERFGKAAARLDDLANLIPARFGAAALAAGAALTADDHASAARIAWTEHRRTASPNAGWPMAAMAGALGVTLAKRAAYRLGDRGVPPSPDAIRRARRLLGAAAALTVAGAVALALIDDEVRRAPRKADPRGAVANEARA
jgi:adenosylcobinamide-phosphate synthase